MSWVLLILIVVSLGAGFYIWARDYAKSSASHLVVESNKNSCSSASLDIVDVCQTSNLVLVDVKNTGSLNVKGLMFSSLSLYDVVNNFEINDTLLVGQTRRFAVPKQGVVELFYVSPVIFSNGAFVKCPRVIASADKVPYCK